MVQILNFKEGSNNYKIKHRSNKLKCPGTFTVPLGARYEHGIYTLNWIYDYNLDVSTCLEQKHV
jgi:hypothetical protein